MSLDDRNAELEQKLEENPIDQQIAALAKADRARRRQVLLLAISLGFDFLLTIGLAYGWKQNNNLAIQAESNKSAIVRNCETSNEARKKNREIWDYVLTVTQRPQYTPEQLKARDDFVTKLNKTFELRDCQAETNKS